MGKTIKLKKIDGKKILFNYNGELHVFTKFGMINKLNQNKKRWDKVVKVKGVMSDGMMDLHLDGDIVWTLSGKVINKIEMAKRCKITCWELDQRFQTTATRGLLVDKNHLYAPKLNTRDVFQQGIAVKNHLW